MISYKIGDFFMFCKAELFLDPGSLEVEGNINEKHSVLIKMYSVVMANMLTPVF